MSWLSELFKKKSQVIVVNSAPITSPYGLQQPDNFYHAIRTFKLFGPTFSSTELSGAQTIIDVCARSRWPVAFTAYVLATAYHETAGTMQPIKEYGGYAYYMKRYDISGDNPSRARSMGNTSIGDGAKYCGRGLVQLTWKNNYAKASKELNIDLVNNPDRALEPLIATNIMMMGMREGWFSGKKLTDYLPLGFQGTKDRYIKCRYIINGTDKAEVLADYALDFQKALLAGGWN